MDNVGSKIGKVIKFSFVSSIISKILAIFLFYGIAKLMKLEWGDYNADYNKAAYVVFLIWILFSLVIIFNWVKDNSLGKLVYSCIAIVMMVVLYVTLTLFTWGVYKYFNVYIYPVVPLIPGFSFPILPFFP